MPEAPPEIGENKESTAPVVTEEKVTRVNWKKDNIIKDARCVTFHILITVEGISKDTFAVPFGELWHKVCEAQWGKRINLIEHVKKTQNKKIKVLDLYMRTSRGLEQAHNNEDPRINMSYRDNWNRLMKFLETGEYPPASVTDEEDIIPEDFEW